MPEEAYREGDDPRVAEIRAAAQKALYGYIPNGSDFNEASLRLTMIVTEALRGLYAAVRQMHGRAEAATAIGAPLRTFTGAMEGEFGDQLQVSIALAEEPDATD